MLAEILKAPDAADDGPPWTRDEFESQLRERGRAYHIHHPFNVMLNSGRAHARAGPRLGGEPLLLPDRDPDQGRGGAVELPRPRGAPRLGAAHPRPRRLRDRRRRARTATGRHRGLAAAGPGGGSARDEVPDLRHVVPGVRFAVDAYVNFARRAPWQEAVCSSLTELFAPEIHKQRLATWPEHYPWIEPEGLAVLPQSREPGAPRRRAGAGDHARPLHTRALQERALEVLQFKLDILWAMNDAMARRYGVTG